MSEMLERVARAIGESYDGYADPVETPNNWARALSAARAAIEAVREPTDAMCDAADWGQQSEVNQYQRAIDAALKG